MEAVSPVIRKRNIRRVIFFSCLGLLLLIGIGISYYLYAFYSFANEIYNNATVNEARYSAYNESPPEADSIDGSVQPPAADTALVETIEDVEWNGKERIQILLLGGDKRGINPEAHPRSDMMMIVSIDPASRKVTLFSLLRDSYVAIPKHGSNRINAALAFGGPQLSVATVSNLVDLPIHHYVYTDFEGFISLIDALGGITFNVEKKMHYAPLHENERYHISLEPGEQLLDGLTALQYVRFRQDAMSDFARSERQRNLLQTIAAKMKTSTSLLKLPKLLDSIAPYIETDIPPDDLFKLGRLLLKVDLDQVESVQLPQQGAFHSQLIDGMDVLAVDLDRIRKYVREQLDPGSIQ